MTRTYPVLSFHISKQLAENICYFIRIPGLMYCTTDLVIFIHIQLIKATMFILFPTTTRARIVSSNFHLFPPIKIDAL